MSALSLHANAVALGEAGVLIRGPSGAGKSELSLALLRSAQARGLYGALVADDRVRLTQAHGRLIARGVKGFEGLIERRVEGLFRVRYEPQAVIRLVVDLAPHGQTLPRFPDSDNREVELLSCRTPAVDLDFWREPGGAVAATWRKLGFDSP